ncbi:hypothetical protein BDS110ZK23_37550 [Bradyrhizobium diazoefficiens]|uniref:Uncharacterized protein n=1 Tax=Bradyrhizobium diazoefficiens TaxID=1355477 RepID=A0A810C7V1_9BRAD|nr:hypothetical protein XF9B_52260 [Bradyrhizobium diazoefficiens]BCF01295.1 hypothetical protein XF11B_53150 [Bradyrhizobium diazoefficiens]BCF09890.1 hypothetical protein XF12B_52630 [Bradyrhizobium diazoefficiens]BCF62330.1 hypothetical protein XF18B_52780 [Bradyrhizobium diazoefficiens]
MTYQDPSPTNVLPWWTGLINPRYAVTIRACVRSAQKLAEKLPLLGEVLKTFSGGRDLFRFLKTGGTPLGFFDILAILAFVFFAATLVYCIDALFVWDLKVRAASYATEPKDFLWWSRIAAWTTTGILFYLFGVYRNQSLYVFAGVFFILAPAAKSLRFSTHPILNGQLLLTAGLALVFCSLIRQVTHRHSTAPDRKP